MTRDRHKEPNQVGGDRGLPGDNATSHPSYGMIGISHAQVSGGGYNLFGSPLETHHTVMCISIRRCERDHTLGRDWFFGRDEIIEVMLSPMQFAELITTPNVGNGVPCTIRHLHGEIIDNPPSEATERVKVKTHFADDMKKLAGRLKKMQADVNTVLSKPKSEIKPGELADLKNRIQLFVQDIESNIPFMLESFDEATDKVTTSAKAEIDAFITGAVHKLGFERLDDLKAALATRDTSRALEPADEPMERGVYLEGDGSAK